MKEILEAIILNMVNNKEAVTITEEANEKSVTFKVSVAEEDFGKVIGKQGRTAKAIRVVMKSAAGKEHKSVSVEFID